VDTDHLVAVDMALMHGSYHVSQQQTFFNK